VSLLYPLVNEVEQQFLGSGWGRAKLSLQFVWHSYANVLHSSQLTTNRLSTWCLSISHMHSSKILIQSKQTDIDHVLNGRSTQMVFCFFPYLNGPKYIQHIRHKFHWPFCIRSRCNAHCTRKHLLVTLSASNLCTLSSANFCITFRWSSDTQHFSPQMDMYLLLQIYRVYLYIPYIGVYID
jgi:hypothetical protein